MRTFTFLLCLSVSSFGFIADAGAQSRQYCRDKCGYVETFGANTGKAPPNSCRRPEPRNAHLNSMF